MNRQLQRFVSKYDSICDGVKSEELANMSVMDANAIIESGNLYSEDDLETIRKLIDTIADTAGIARKRADVLTDTAIDLAVYLVEYEQENKEPTTHVKARVHAYIDAKLQAIEESPEKFAFDFGAPTLKDAYLDCRTAVDKYDCKDVESLTRAYFEVNNLTNSEHDFLYMRNYKDCVAGTPNESKLARVNARIDAYEGVGGIMREYLSAREQARQTAAETVRKRIQHNQ